MGYASDVETIAEIVFNTSMVGYQEIVTDPSYYNQIVVMSYPLIGNYGVNQDDIESRRVFLSGLVIRDYNDYPSNFRSQKELQKLLKENNVPLISDVDTRKMVRIIREKGSMPALITDALTPNDICFQKLQEYKYQRNQVSSVSHTEVITYDVLDYKYVVVCIDFGCKYNIIRKLNAFKCKVIVVPYDTVYQEILKYQPDGLFLSNGPGDPMDNKVAIEVVKNLKGKLPIFGICLGHQIISLASGATTYKLRFGHRGANHPVKNLETQKIEITPQNHSFAVEKQSLEKTDLKITHINLLDDTIEGLENKDKMIFSVQYHPEASSGPEDSEYLFSKFIHYMEKFKGEKNA